MARGESSSGKSERPVAARKSSVGHDTPDLSPEAPPPDRTAAAATAAVELEQSSASLSLSGPASSVALPVPRKSSARSGSEKSAARPVSKKAAAAARPASKKAAARPASKKPSVEPFPSAEPFPFLLLPSELRLKIYRYHFAPVSYVLDYDPDNPKMVRPLLALLRTCRLVREEATHLFWSTHAARIFSVHPCRFSKIRRPLLARLREHQRASLGALQLRLGPGWNRPPPGWVVNDALGLASCVGVRRLHVFVECDPSDGVFKGFRRADGFYESFSCGLLSEILAALPALEEIEFDAWSSVKKSGAMMRGLLDTATTESSCAIRWGPEKGWTDADEDEEEEERRRQEEEARVQAEILQVTSDVGFSGYGYQDVTATA